MIATYERTHVPACSIAEIAEAKLQASPYLPVRRIVCIDQQGRLILQGRLPSFFHKQLAQAAVAGIRGIEQVVNLIEVV